MRQVVTAVDVPASGELRVPVGAIVTPSAREVAAARGVRILEVPEDQVSALAPPEKTVAIGADHGGFRLKEALKPVLEEPRPRSARRRRLRREAGRLSRSRAQGGRTGGLRRGRARRRDRWRGHRFVAWRPTRFRASARPCAMIKLPPEIAANTMILMYLRSARGS